MLFIFNFVECVKTPILKLPSWLETKRLILFNSKATKFQWNIILKNYANRLNLKQTRFQRKLLPKFKFINNRSVVEIWKSASVHNPRKLLSLGSRVVSSFQVKNELCNWFSWSRDCRFIGPTSNTRSLDLFILSRALRRNKSLWWYLVVIKGREIGILKGATPPCSYRYSHFIRRILKDAHAP